MSGSENRKPPPSPCFAILLKTSRQQRAACVEAYGRTCGYCGHLFPLAELEAEHIFPLWLVDREKPDAWKFWTIDNLRWACKAQCHKQKSRGEAARRAKMKRLQAQAPVTKRKREKRERWAPRPPKQIDIE